jgi:hypothetical protein
MISALVRDSQFSGICGLNPFIFANLSKKERRSLLSIQSKLEKKFLYLSSCYLVGNFGFECLIQDKQRQLR